MSLLLVAAATWSAWHAPSTTLRVVAAAFAAGAVAVQIDQRTGIAGTAGTVTREVTLWGRRLRATRWPLSDFDHVGAHRLPAGPPQAPRELVHVGLRRHTGGLLAFRYFSTGRGQPCPAAVEFARDLAEASRLPVGEVI
jgi:hypothetical protein